MWYEFMAFLKQFHPIKKQSIFSKLSRKTMRKFIVCFVIVTACNLLITNNVYGYYYITYKYFKIIQAEAPNKF